MQSQPLGRLQTAVKQLQHKTRVLREGGLDRENALQVGLKPVEGWRERNVRFMQNVLIPSMFVPRGKRPGRWKIKADPETLGAVWIGHATFLLQINGLNILTDPNWAFWHGIVKRVRQPGIALDDLPRIDLVLVSHAHFDHLHLQSLARIADLQTIVVPKGVGSLVRRFPFAEVIELDTWGQTRYRDLKLTLCPARHWGARYVHDVHRGFGGFLVESPSRTFFHAGDSAYFEGFKEIGQRAEIDLALLPIGAYEAPSGRQVHMNPEEAMEAFKDLKAKNMVPMHYGTFPLGAEPLEEPAERLIDSAIKSELADRIHVAHEGELLRV